MFFTLAPRKRFGAFGCYPAAVLQNLVLVEFQEAVEAHRPILHSYWDVPSGLVLPIVQIHKDDPLQSLQFILIKMILRNRHIVFLNFAVRVVLPRGESHVRLLRIGSAHDKLRSGVPVNCPVELVLYLCKKILRDFGRFVVIQGGFVYVRDFLIEPTLGKTHLTNPLQQVVGVLLREYRSAIFQPPVIPDPTLNGVVFDDEICPLPELNGTVIIDLEIDGNDYLRIVVHDLSAYLGFPSF